MSLTPLILIFLRYLVISDCAKILAIFPAVSISHQVVFRPITEELVRRGHEVTVVTPDPAFQNGEAPANLTEIDIHEISYAFKDQFYAISASNDTNNSQIESIYILLLRLSNAQLESQEMRDLIANKSKQFDLLLLEACFRTLLAFSHVFKVPVIQISSFGSFGYENYVMGSAIHPIYHPTAFFQKKIGNHSFFEKIHSLYNQYVYQGIADSYEVLENVMLKKHFGPDVPSLNELANNVDMLFLNAHPIWEGNRPVAPNVVYLGGLPQKPEKILPEGLKSYLDSSRHGVIYISFGTNMNPSQLSADKMQVFLKVFSQLQYEVLWKWNEDVMAEKPSNVRIGKWFPQSDLLKHPNVKLFITQGGLQSIDETIMASVPIVGIPFYGDQWFNIEKCVQHGVGVKLELEDMNESILTEIIKRVIGNTSYTKNVAKLRSMLYDQPQTALERAIYWTEYVIKYGGARHLRSPAANTSWIQYYQLDVVCFLLAVLMMIMISVCGTLFLIIKFVFTKNGKVKSS